MPGRFVPVSWHRGYPLLFSRFLQVIKPKEDEPDAAEFSEHVQQALASALNIQSSNLIEGDVQKWLAG